MSTAVATIERATALFQTALLYTISSAAITSLVETSNSSYIPIVVLTAFGGIGIAVHALSRLGDGTNDSLIVKELYQLIRHLLELTVDILVQLASNGVGRLVLFAFMGSESLMATVLGVVVSIVLLWALRQSAVIT